MSGDGTRPSRCRPGVCVGEPWTSPSTISPWELVAVIMTSPQQAHSGFAVMYATQHHLSLRVGRGDYDPPPAGTKGWW